MTDPQRRKFLQYSAALGGAVPLVGCGGGGNEAAAATPDLPTADPALIKLPSTPVSPTPVPPPAPAPTPAPAPSPIPAATATLGLFTGAMQFSLISAKSQTKAPFCLGFAFKRGDIPAGSTVGSNLSDLQVTPRTTWPDGSLKFAQIAGFAALTANTLTTVRLRRIAADARVISALTLADLKKTGITAEVGAGALGTASFGAADWDAPLSTWVSGPQMSSWVFRKPVGSDAHLTAWLEVRLYAGGAVEVLPWLENGYLMVDGPTNKSATYSFKINGTQRFSAAIDLPHHTRTPLISGTALSYWLADDPGVTPRHDLAYLQATEQVPTYSARVDANAGVAKALVATFSPLDKGNFNYDGDSMAATGYQEPIGLLPQHDVLYLTSEHPNTYAAVVRNGFASGRWSIHYRDEKTQRPIRFSQYPNLVLHGDSRVNDLGGSTRSQYTPKPTGTLTPRWDCAHSPSIGYMAYLVTGRWYFMEQVQFVATLNYLGKSDNSIMRRGALGLVQACFGGWQTRACAWQWRALTQALNVTPDNDTALRQEFINSVQSNIDDFHSVYVAQPNNPFGWILPGEGYDNEMQSGAPWQQDFVTAAFGFSLALGLPLSTATASKHDAFFRWKARSAVMRLGPKTGFWYVNPAPYTMSITPVAVPDYLGGKGPWYPTDAAVYAATYASVPAWLGNLEGKLAAEFLPGDRAALGNLTTALAYAVRHGVNGAATAYQRLITTSNYPALRDAFNVNPVWAVSPARITPAWMASKAIGEWFEIPDTAGAGGAAIDAFSGMAINELTSEILIAAAGGHSDSADNRVVSLSLAADTPSWVTRLAPSKTVAQNVAYYTDGLPSSRHLYSSLHFVPQLNRLMLFGAYATYGSAWAFPKIDGFNLDTNKWDAAGTWPEMPSGQYGATAIRSTGEIVSTGLNKWSPVDRKWTDLAATRIADSARWPIAFDARRGQLFSLQWGDGQGFDPQRMVSSRIPLGSNQQIAVSFNPSAALTQWLAEKPTYAALDYDMDNDRFLFYGGQGNAAGRVYVITPNDSNVWDMSLLSVGAGSVKIAATPDSGVHNRLRYIPALRGFVLLARSSSNLYFMRTA
ncbi:hypothetical protein ACS5PN_09860 [Roseateles sp. NT4]|uniref:hypothetical protein n=1 Tax=Roseateles sp. NT4 TaxID=3453715 RepID=UPI003EEDC324